MTTGTERRAGRFFDRTSRRTMVVAFDHGLLTGPMPGGIDVSATVRSVLAGAPDGVVLSPGVLPLVADQFAHRDSANVIVRADYLSVGAFQRGSGEHHRQLIEPTRAQAMGADALMVFLALGVSDGAAYADNVRTVADIVDGAHTVGLPVFVETVLWGQTIEDERDPELLAEGCRLAAELGADIVKTQYTGASASMRDVIAGCPVPVTVLGGSKIPVDELIAQTEGALQAGAAGCAYGRNVWQDEDPAGLCRRLRGVLHGPEAGDA